MRLFLFDIDGTLLWSGGAGARALDLAFADLFGIQDAMAKVSCDGKTDPLIVREVLGPRGLDSPDHIAACLTRYVEHLERTLPDHPGYRLLPGAVDSLTHLSELELPCGLATGNLEAGARLKLVRGGLDAYFAFGGYGSDAEERSDLVRIAIQRGREQTGCSQADAVVIGDTPRDVLAAHQAGVPAIGVAAGNFSMAELGASGAEMLVPDLRFPERWVPKALSLKLA